MENILNQNRNFMKCPKLGEAMQHSDQSKGLAHPPHGHAVTGPLITLPPFDECPVLYPDLLDKRRSIRTFDKLKPMSAAQLAFVLYSAQGIQEYRGKDEAFTLRPVPSGGARHPFETYVAVKNVEGLKKGLYYYAPTANVQKKQVALSFVKPIDDYENFVTKMLAGQNWAANASAILFISCIPYRSEWRYAEHSHRVILIDLGHVGQNIMLSATGLGLGSCCMAAYDQEVCDEFLNLDGNNEYTVYAVAIGVPK